MSLRRRIVAGMAANGVGQLITIGSQLLLLPVLLHTWGSERYADWVLLSTIPSYVSMMDGGLGAVAGNQMTLDHAAGRLDRVHAVADAAFRWLTIILGLLLALAAALAWAVPWPDLLHLGPTTAHQSALVALALATSTLIGLWIGVLAGLLRAENRYASGVMLGNGVRLGEALACGLIAWYGGGLVAAAVGMASIKFISAGFSLFLCHHWIGWLPNLRRGQWADLRPLLPAAGAQVAMPFAYAMSLQGTVIAIAHAINAEAAAAFNAMRMLTRLMTQATTMIGNSVGPELARHVGADQHVVAWRLLMRTTISAMVLASLIAIGLLLTGPWIFAHWTHGQLAFHPGLWITLLISALLYCLWNTLSYLPVSINCHARISLVFCPASILTPFLVFICAVYGGLGWSAIGLVALEISLSATTLVWLIHWRRHWIEMPQSPL